jgi:hypothetical protein
VSLTTEAITLTVEFPPSGWHYTQGWGALATVTVAILALMATTFFNIVTTSFTVVALFRTSRQFQQSRLDARNDALRVEINGLLDAISEREIRWTMATQRVSDLMPQPLTKLDDESLKAAGTSLKAALTELLSGTYTRMGTHVIAIEILTDDPGILARVSQINQRGGAERELLDKVLLLMGRLRTQDDVSKLNGPFEQLMQVGSSNTITLEKRALVDYVTGEWARKNR